MGTLAFSHFPVVPVDFVQRCTQCVICPSLEMTFLEQVCAPHGLTEDCDFDLYLEPNEGTPKNVKPHLDLMEKGLIKGRSYQSCETLLSLEWVSRAFRQRSLGAFCGGRES